LLKSPDHLPAIDAILRVYPDACLLHIHRDPARSVSSWAALNLVYRSVYYRHIDRDALGRQVLKRLADDMDRYLTARATLPTRQFHDVDYREFIKNPPAAIRQIYAHFGFQLSEQATRRMNEYLAANPRHKYGAHTYAPEDFGLNAEAIRRRFADYVAAFKIPTKE
jgi:hypothetical protein